MEKGFRDRGRSACIKRMPSGTKGTTHGNAEKKQSDTAISIGFVHAEFFAVYETLAGTIELKGLAVFLDVGQTARQCLLLGLKCRFFPPENCSLAIKAICPCAEYEAGGLPITISLKSDPAVDIEKETVAKMGFPFPFIAAGTNSAGKILSLNS